MKKYLPLLMVVLMGIPFLGSFRVPKDSGAFYINDFGRIPVLQNGRVKPLDTIARNALLVIHGSQTLRDEGREIPAREWLIEVLSGDPKADERRIFRIYDEDILGLIHQEPDKERYFSAAEVFAYSKELADASARADEVKDANRSRFQKAVVQLVNCMNIYRALQNTLFIQESAGAVSETQGFLDNIDSARKLWMQSHMSTPTQSPAESPPIEVLEERYQYLEHTAYFLPLAPMAGESPDEWRSIGRSFREGLQGQSFHPITLSFARLVDGYRKRSPELFNQAVAEIRADAAIRAGHQMRNAGWEFLFNQSQPFYQGILIYVVAALLVFISWLAWGPAMTRAAFALLILGFVVHTLGLVSRIYLQGRPPVTNLYSSAIFVGWIAVMIGIMLERLFRNGFATLGTAIVGTITLIIAHHLSMSGDTMEMMQAVLDSNFWLSTHVVTITIGYGSSFVAGILAHIAIFRRFFRPSSSDEVYRSLARMTYGVACFSLFLSFVGTTLGGIWADQSWGRFWGWDPKENGALLIVLWYAIVLHCRMASLIRERGLMVMTVFGSVVTSFSWFGVNMLGIGLHSYGFIEKTFYWLLGFVIFEVVVMLIGIQPPLDPSAVRAKDRS